MTHDTLSAEPLDVVAGSLVVVRDEEWLVTGVEATRDGTLVTVRGLSELVRDTEARFFSGLDDIEVLDPRETRVVADASPGYRQARLWLESTLRRTSVPADDPSLTVVDGMLADPLDYQRTAVRQALDPRILRPRILLADAVGLGKTLEIGMILSELVRRGRGERILIVTPRHVLEQMQHEMWSRFALPFVRLDSTGIQRLRRRMPANRNPFGVYSRAIISIDTLKSDRYLAHLRNTHWDAVVIDESHNITNSATQNNRLAGELAPRTEALILASATPHNGTKESFAELVRLLEPTAVGPDGEISRAELNRLVIRRHRHSPEVARTVGQDWAERAEPVHRLVDASAVENEVAAEIADTWLYRGGANRSRGQALFGWTLAKAFLSSPAALAETVAGRLSRTVSEQERQELVRLAELADRAAAGDSAKYDALVAELRRIGVGPGTEPRVVVFAERIATLHWLREKVMPDLGMSPAQVRVMHGSLSDVEQQELVEEFKQRSSPVRVLITGDVASEGVNLHLQCHELVHYDIPWSLIRLEQRNGRIDRYGQRHSPRITALLLQPDHERFRGDVRVLSRLIDKEHEAHRALGDSASLMGKHSVRGEEDEIVKVLAGVRELDEVVRRPEEVLGSDSADGLLAQLGVLGLSGSDDAVTPAPVTTPDAIPAPSQRTTGELLFGEPVDYLRDALRAAFPRPQDAPDDHGGGGVGWTEHPAERIVELTPPSDLRARLEVLPQDYRRDRRVAERLRLATTPARGRAELERALEDESGSSWPEAHFLGPLHPVLDWAGDRALSALARGEVYAIRGVGQGWSVLMSGTLMNAVGQTVAATWLRAVFADLDDAGAPFITPYASAADMLDAVGAGHRMSNPGPVADADALARLIPRALDEAAVTMDVTLGSSERLARARVEEWMTRADRWVHDADALIQRADLRQRRVDVDVEKRLVRDRLPERRHLRPLLVVTPEDHPADRGEGGERAGQ